jgi:hypothetical protein
LRKPAETFPLSEFLQDEMKARGWSLAEVHRRLMFDPVLCCAIDLAIYVDDKDLRLDGRTVQSLALVFGADPQYYINLYEAHRSQSQTS